MELTGMYEQLGISEKVLKFARETEAALKERFEAVSYTHLDVYKRQSRERLRRISRRPWMW